MTQAALQTVEKRPASLVEKFAARFSVEPNKLLGTLKATAFKQRGNQQVTNEDMMALIVVADQYKLNPFTKEIYAFPSNGGIVPIVSIDGWLNIINSHPNFDGMEFDDKFDDNGNIISITCKMYRADRNHPTEVTEYLSECKRNTDPWKQWPVRMLRHKATIQAARYAFSFSGIYDQDEAERIIEGEVIAEQPAQSRQSDNRTSSIIDKIGGESEPIEKEQHANLDDLIGMLDTATDQDCINDVMSLSGELNSDDQAELLEAIKAKKDDLGIKE